MESAPSVKSAHMKSIMKHIQTLPGDYPDKVLQLMAPETLKAIEESIKLKWLPVVLDKEVTEASYRAMPEERFSKFWEDYGVATLKNPLLRQAFNAAKRLFGLTTGKMLTWTPRIFSAYYHNCGELVVGDRSEKHCNLIQQNFPRDMISLSYMKGFAYCYAAIFPLTKIEGRVTLRDFNPDQGSVRFLFEW